MYVYNIRSNLVINGAADIDRVWGEGLLVVAHAAHAGAAVAERAVH